MGDPLQRSLDTLKSLVKNFEHTSFETPSRKSETFAERIARVLNVDLDQTQIQENATFYKLIAGVELKELQDEDSMFWNKDGNLKKIKHRDDGFLSLASILVDLGCSLSRSDVTSFFSMLTESELC